MQDVMDLKEKAKNNPFNKHKDLSVGDIIDIHNIVIDSMVIFKKHPYPEAYKIDDIAKLKQIVSKKYSPIEKKAASYFYDFSKHDVFAIGSKRTGVLASQMLLAQNNLELDLTNIEIYNLSIDITEEKIKKSDFINYFMEHTVPIEIIEKTQSNDINAVEDYIKA